MANDVGQQPDDRVRRPVTRRNFIVWYLAGLLTATEVAIIAPLLPFIYPPQGNTRRQDIRIKLDRAPSELQNGEAVKFASPSDTGFVMKDGGGDNAPGKVAFSGYVAKDAGGALNVFAVNCSHLGCSVQLNASAERFECPSHGSRFSIGGEVVHGPAVYPLSHLTWHQGANPDEIIVAGVSLPGVG